MNKLKDGQEYELFVLSNIKTKYKSCWLWKDVPENILPHQFYKNKLTIYNITIGNKIGIDILTINFSITFLFILKYTIVI